MTSDQDKVFDWVVERLGEHFQSFVVTAQTVDPEDLSTTEVRIHYGGGQDAALGLVSRTVLYIKRDMMNDVEGAEDDDDDDGEEWKRGGVPR